MSSLWRLSFIAEWFQEEASMVRKFILNFYLNDNAVEVLDIRNKKTFLRRTQMQDLSEKDFFVGSKVTIFGRQYDIVDYGDDITRSTLSKYRVKTFILVKNFVVHHLGTILCALIDSRFSINKGLMVLFTSDEVNKFLGEQNKGNVETSVLMNQLISGPSIALELIADNAVQKIKQCHTQSPEVQNDPHLRPLITLFEREEIRNGIYCSPSSENAAKDTNFFFNACNLNINCRLENTTLGIIKPHAIKEGKMGKIINEILNNGFDITGMRMHMLERANAEEFYEVYRGILPEYIQMCSQLSAGVCMALEISCKDKTKNSYEEFRSFCGPMDPEIAKLLRPHTLRAKFGETKSLNAIHCTDLPDDTVIEVQYLFKIL